MKVLVTGGGGFLGGAVARSALARGWQVRSVARGDYPHLREAGMETHRGDLAEPGVAHKAVEGCDAVFHVAAKAGVWGSYESYHRSNVTATEQLLDACRKQGVKRFIYTSTPSVIHAGGDVEGIDESAPYPDHFETHYPKTKAIAEKMVLKASGPELGTVALRPHLIWGPGDTQLIPRILARAKAGRLRFVGDGQKLIDSVYIDNAAQAHMQACDALANPQAACAGKAYFITQGEPVPTADLINRILGAAGLPPCTKTVPVKVAYAAGAMLEGVYGLFRIASEPPMTRFVAKQLSTAHWYDITAAKRDLGYKPTITLDEGIEKLRQSFAK